MTTRKVTLSGVLDQQAQIRNESGLILPRIKDYQLKTFGWDSDRDPMVVHPSELAKSTWCPRATYKRIISGAWPPDPGKYDFIRENIFAAGNDIHAKYQTWMQEAGLPLWGDWECALCQSRVTGLKPEPFIDDDMGCVYDDGHMWDYDEVTLNARDQLLIAGHSDGAFGSSLVEIKSIGLGTLRIDAPELLSRYQDGKMTDLTGLWRAIRAPLKSHRIQGDVYLHLAHVLGLPFDQIVYLYEFKPNQMVKEFTVKYDPERSMPLVAKAEKVKYAVDNRIPPECINPGKCKECDAFPTRRTVAGTRPVNP